jgi:hypothetical protein
LRYWNSLLARVCVFSVACFLSAVNAGAASYSIRSGGATPTVVAPGQTVAIKADFIVGQASTVATYFEIRNSQNVIVASQSYNNQSFSSGQLRSYTWNITVPSNPPEGTYRVHAGIFTADFSKNLQWVANSSGFAVATPTQTSTYAIGNGSAAPAAVAPGQAVAIRADFTAGQATVATYFEIRNASNVIVGSQSYNNQAFSSGQARPYTWNFTVPGDWEAGSYVVHAGIFAPDWSRNLQWVSGSSSFAVASAPTPTSGRQFYVDSNSGSDSNGGTSSSTPWRSLNKVNSSTFQPGDAINFQRGSVWTGNLQVRSSGTSSSPITYRAYGTGAAPQIANPGVTYGEAVSVTGSFNLIQDFLLSDAHAAGVMIRAGAVGNVIRTNEITRTGTGVMVSGQYNVMVGNYVHDLTMIVNDPAPWTDYGAVCFWLQASNNEVAYNRGINCRAPSYDFGHDGGFVEVWQTGDNSYIHHNYAENTNGFFELGSSGDGSAQNIRVAYNTIVNVTAEGAGTSVCFNTGTYNISVGTFRFENNTYVSTAGHPQAYRVFGCRSDLSMLVLRNNIFYSDLQIANNGNFTHTNNLYNMVSMVNGSGVGYGLGSGERIGDPLFVNLGAHDLRLQTGSPAIDAGVNLGYTVDFLGTPLAQGSSADIGAYELKR